MLLVISLEFEHVRWSWGHTSQALFRELGEDYNVVSIDHREWRKYKGEDYVRLGERPDQLHACFLSQSVTQLKDVTAYERTIARLGGNRPFENTASFRTKDYLEKMSKCFAIVATNGKLATIARSVHKKVRVIPNGLDLEEWKFIPKEITGEAPLRVGFVGNISTPPKSLYKGYEITKTVCSNMGFPLIEALYLNKQIPHDKMQSNFYARVDVVVLLTDGEGCSNTIMEALTCGVPVITTKVAGYHGERLEHRKNVLFSKKTISGLTYQLEKLQNNPALYQKIALRGREFAEKHHDIKKIAIKYKRLFQQCIDTYGVIEEKPMVVPAKKITRTKFTEKKYLTKPSKSEITVMCVLKSGGPYTPEYVVKLKNMVRRNTTIPFDFLCLTDMEQVADGINQVQLKDNLQGWWSKIELFRKGLVKTKRAFYFDLDTVIVKNIDPLFSLDHEFAALLPWNAQNRLNGLCASGMMGWKNGSFSFIYTDFSSTLIKDFKRGDQEYISDVLRKHEKPFYPLQKSISGIYSYKRSCRRFLPPDACVVTFHGRPRLSEVDHKWMKEHWQ